MDKPVLVVGSSGAIGKQVVQSLSKRAVIPILISSSQLRILGIADLDEFLREILLRHDIEDPSTSTLGLILAHRCRSNDTLAALESELRITRDFVWTLSKICLSLRAVVLGSITGRLIDAKSSEAYHYSKDLQKSIVRQSVRIPNLSMNLLELSWFRKYLDSDATQEYRRAMKDLDSKLGKGNVPTVETITDFACNVIESLRPPRGQVITYDGGFSQLQDNQIVRSYV